MSAAIIREQLLNCIPELQDDDNLLSECWSNFQLTVLIDLRDYLSFRYKCLPKLQYLRRSFFLQSGGNTLQWKGQYANLADSVSHIRGCGRYQEGPHRGLR